MSTDYPSDWNSRRKRVYKRDDYTCQNCGIGGGSYGNAELHAHHVVPKSRGGTHDVSNLITLCNQCHKTVHSKNTHAPTAYQEHGQEFGHSEPDYGDIADAVFDDTLTIVSAAGELLVSTQERLEAGSLDFEDVLEAENELRIGIISTFEHIDQLRSSSALGYPSDLVESAEMCIDEAEELLVIVMTTLDLVEECIFDLVDQVTSCPTCGTDVDESDAFCGGCGSDLQEMIPTCPSCDAEASTEDTFCRSCGEELAGHEGPILGSAQISPDWKRRMEKNLQELDQAIERYVISRIHVQIQIRLQSETLTSVAWEHCPSCGYPQGALRSTKGIECVACDSEWKDKGIINRELKMTRGDEKGKSMPSSDWERLGEQRYEEKRFRDVLFSDSFFK